jgi:hypothetical protein
VSDTHEYGHQTPENQGPAPGFDEPNLAGAFVFTWLRDQYANQKRLIRLPSPDKFAACLRATTAVTKAGLPWAKLAEFGPTRSPNDSYRYDANVVALFGCEGDFDGDDFPIEDAADRIQAAGVAAILNKTTTTGHWRIWLPASRAYRGSADELRTLRARWVARVNGILGGILARESFVLSQAFYVGGIKGQPPIKVIVTEGARIDQCDDLDADPVYANAASSPTERQQVEEFEEDPAEDGDDPRLLAECKAIVANCAKHYGYGRMPMGDHAHRLVQWLANIRTRDGLTPSAEMIRDVIRADYPNTTVAMVEDMLSRRKQPRGWDVIDPLPELPWDVEMADETEETTND